MAASGCLISCASAPVAASTVTSRSPCSRFNECNVRTSFAYKFVVVREQNQQHHCRSNKTKDADRVPTDVKTTRSE